MKASVCIATYDKHRYLLHVLRSVVRQQPPFSWELIVVDDGSPANETRRVCVAFPEVRYLRINREPGWRNPSVARNIAYRAARGDVLVMQSDDVEHQGDALAGLVNQLVVGQFVIAYVRNVDWEGQIVRRPLPVFTGPQVRRPLFFLGAAWREDVCAVGGNEEQFTGPGRDDLYFSQCLMHGRGLRSLYPGSVVGHHLDHPRPADIGLRCEPSNVLYRMRVEQIKRGEAHWTASGGPWPYVPGAPVDVLLTAGASRERG